MIVIGLAGKAGAGKDYCARIVQNLAREMGINLMIFPMALILKALLLGQHEDLTYEDVFYNKPPNVRRLLQLAGTENGRNVYGEDVWVRATSAMSSFLLSNNPFIQGIVIPDIRYTNEAQIVQASGSLLRVISDRGTLDGLAAQHLSENAMADYYKYDLDIINNLNTTQFELESQIWGFMYEQYKDYNPNG